MFFFKLRARPWKAWWKGTSLGYESVVYPSTQDTGSLRDTRYEEFAFFPGPVPDWTDMPKVRSLRASFARILLDPAFEDDDFIIFGESYSTPAVEASVLRQAVEEEFLRHPEADILRPFLELAPGPSLRPPARHICVLSRSVLVRAHRILTMYGVFTQSLFQGGTAGR